MPAPPPRTWALKPASRWQKEASYLAQGESPGVDVHARDPNVLEGGGQQEGCPRRDVAQQVRVLLAAFQLKGDVVQHLLVLVAGLLHLEPVDLAPEGHQLPCQLVVQGLHFSLGRKREEGPSGAESVKQDLYSTFQQKVHKAVYRLAAAAAESGCLQQKLAEIQQLATILENVNIVLPAPSTSSLQEINQCYSTAVVTTKELGCKIIKPKYQHNTSPKWKIKLESKIASFKVRHQQVEEDERKEEEE